MKFIKLESRGGNYLVVAENIAWLRTAENGQTSVGMMGGQPLLVVGSIEEVAEKILSATREQEQPEAAVPAEAAPDPKAFPQPIKQAPVTVAPAPLPEDTEPNTHPAIEQDAAEDDAAQDPEPEQEPEQERVAPISEKIPPEPEPAQSEPAPSVAADSATSGSSPVIARIPNRNAVPLWERSVPRAAASSTGLRVKGGSQRFMGKHD
jgi:uncharacterized protein YlzI (FlbEa/FlbD family)